jgi:hypothetical protein
VIPTTWRQKQDYKEFFFDVINKDKKFFEYISTKPKEEKFEILVSDPSSKTEDNFKRTNLQKNSLMKNTSRKEIDPSLFFEAKNFLSKTKSVDFKGRPSFPKSTLKMFNKTSYKGKSELLH